MRITYINSFVLLFFIVGCNTSKSINTETTVHILKKSGENKNWFIIEDLEDTPTPGLKKAILHEIQQGEHNFSKYFLLKYLYQKDKTLYEKIPSLIRAKIMTSTLKERMALNDFGSLPIGNKGCNFGETGRILIDSQNDAVVCLFPLLQDFRKAELAGSEDCTLSIIYKYRIADYAYFYIMSIVKDDSPIEIPISVDKRNTMIDRLRKELMPLVKNRRTPHERNPGKNHDAYPESAPISRTTGG